MSGVVPAARPPAPSRENDVLLVELAGTRAVVQAAEQPVAHMAQRGRVAVTAFAARAS